MPVVNVRLADLSRAIGASVKGQRDLAVRAIRRSVGQHAPRLAVEAVESSSPKPVDRGTYRRSFRVEDLPDGASFYNYAPHAGVIEDGRRPGSRMPPVDVIEDWLRRKLRVAIKEGRHGRMSDADFRSAAWMIARSIAARGLPPHRVLARVNARLVPVVEAEVLRALLRGSP